MSEKEGEATGLWLIVVLVVVAVGLVVKDQFRKPTPRPRPAAETAAMPNATAPAQPVSGTSDSIRMPDARVVFESDEFADVAPNVPASVRPKGPPPMVSGKPLDLMKYTLRALILAQEAYSAETGFTNYAKRASDLKEMPAYPGVTLTILQASGNGYSAITTHSALPNGRCALYVGDAAQVAPAIRAGEIGCRKN